MKEVAERLDKSFGRLPEATALEDRLGVCMKFIRAAERGLIGEISSCIVRYPLIKNLVDNHMIFMGILR